MRDSLNIAIAGATGYVGLQLVKILTKHPSAKIKYLCATQSIGKRIRFFDKTIIDKKLPKISSVNNINWNLINVIFTALPNGEAQKIAKIIPSDVKLIDLSGDFRLKDIKLYKKWYGINHKCKNLLSKSIYSITEFARENLPMYNIISCPGCYPTSVQIPLVPLIKNKMINTKKIIIDSKSGFSGGGKDIKNKFKSVDLNNSVTAYGVGNHKHVPEIEQELSKVAKKNIRISFTPHLIPMFRGILSTMYLDTTKKNNAKKIYNYLKSYHKNNIFIKFAKFNKSLSTSEVINTNNCYISVCENRTKNQVIIISAIDNLIKGASGQAVQNMNVVFNLKETMGLL